jgi:hypothetical protein
MATISGVAKDAAMHSRGPAPNGKNATRSAEHRPGATHESEMRRVYTGGAMSVRYARVFPADYRNLSAEFWQKAEVE